MQRTINSITKLEIMLESKLELFSCNICDKCNQSDVCEYCDRSNEEYKNE